MSDAASSGHPDLCACAEFKLWFESPYNWKYCECGHSAVEHIDREGFDRMGSCTGEVVC